MAQLEHIEAIEKRLWRAADTLRANSNYASNEYFMPVMGLIFLRHAYSRYLAVKDAIEASLPTRGGKTRDLTLASYTETDVHLKADEVFRHVFRVYPVLPSPYFGLPAQVPPSRRAPWTAYGRPGTRHFTS